MEMHQIRYFLAIAEELNFTRAAEKCNVSQPSLTRAIKLLEDEFGGQLFRRERTRSHLSELGLIVYPYLKDVLEQTNVARKHAKDFTGLKQTVLKLGIMCTVSPVQLVDLLIALQANYGGIELQLIDASANDLRDRLLTGALDVAIYCHGDGRHEELFHYLPLFQEQFMIVLPPEHRLAMNNAVRVKDLDGERYLNRIKCEMNGYAGQIWEAHGAKCTVAYRSERDDWILAVIAAGFGFGFMPEYSITHPGVVYRPLVEPEFWREVNLVTVRGRPHTPAVGALIREAVRVRYPAQQSALRN